jgi:signal peptidase I
MKSAFMGLLIASIASCILLTSCKHSTITLLASTDMESTIPKGAKVGFEQVDKKDLKRNDIVLVESIMKVSGMKTQKMLRVVGIPGDKIEIKNGIVFVNDLRFDFPPQSKFSYYIRSSTPITALLSSQNYSQVSQNEYYVFLDSMEAKTVAEIKEIDSMSKLIAEPTFPERGIISNSKFLYRNSYFLGPLYIPTKGDIIDNDILSIIPNYLERNELGLKISENYYFLMADNRFNSIDSRYLGLVPASAIQGKLVKAENK